MHSTTAQWRNAALLVVCLAAPAAAASAQQSTTTSETKHFQVISVEGNKVVAKLPEGAREITVPEDFRFTVDGREVSVHELQPGMKGTAKITTITTVTPVTVTEVRNGEVMQASGSSIIVKSANGIKMFNEGDIAKRNVTILKDGKPASIADFHTGDRGSRREFRAIPRHRSSIPARHASHFGRKTSRHGLRTSDRRRARRRGSDFSYARGRGPKRNAVAITICYRE